MKIYSNYGWREGSYIDFLNNSFLFKKRPFDPFQWEDYDKYKPTTRQLAKFLASEMVDISCRTHIFRQYWMDYTKLVFTSNSYDYDEFFGKEFARMHPSLYVMFLRFACKLIKKEFNKDNYVGIYDKCKSFLYDLYFSDEMDFCKAVNNSLLKNNINSLKFNYTCKTIEKEFEKNITLIKNDLLKISDYKYESNKEISYITKAFNNMRIDTPPRTYGVYFLFDNNLSLMYIGYSNNLQMRILQSMKDKKLRNFAYLSCNTKEEATSLETYFITKLKPKLNSAQKHFEHKNVNFEIPPITDIYCLKVDELMIAKKIPKDFDVFKVEKLNILD